MAEIILAELTAHDGGTTQTLRFGTEHFVTGGRNLLPYSEDFYTPTSWLKAALTFTQWQASPDGLNTGTYIADADASNSRYLQWANIAYTAGTAMCLSWYIKKDAVGRATRFPSLRMSFDGLGAAGRADIAFDTSTGESSATATNGTGTTTLIGSGVEDHGDWWRVWLAASNSSATTVNLTLFPAAGASASWVTSVAATGNVTHWGAQLEPATSPRFYQPTNGTAISDWRYYDGRISQPGNIQRNIFDNRTTFGASRVGYGEMILVNSDGALDGYLGYGFSGFPIVIKRGVLNPDSIVPTWTTEFSGLIETADFSWNEISIKVRDRQQDLTKPLQPLRYGGTNVLPNGIDGVADDLKGKPRPLLLGKAFNFPPPCVNTTRQIYELSSAAVYSVDAVYDRGVTLTAGAAYASQADMEANVPAAGQYRLWMTGAGTYIRLGSTPTGTITVDATHYAPSSCLASSLMINGVLVGQYGYLLSDIDDAGFLAMDAVASYECGAWFGPDREWTGVETMDIFASSVGGWWGANRTGKFTAGPVADPSTLQPIGEISELEIIKIDRIRSSDQGAGIPAWQIKLGYKVMQLTQADLGSTVSASLKAERAQRSRTITKNDASVKTQWPKAVEISFDTAIVGTSNADTEATRRFNLYKVRRDMFQVRARLEEAVANSLDLGEALTLRLDRFGLQAGKPYLITGIRTDMRGNIFDLTLWG